MKYETVKLYGEYLGFCKQKGYIYSVCRETKTTGIKNYTIVALYNGEVYYLIDYTGTC